MNSRTTLSLIQSEDYNTLLKEAIQFGLNTSDLIAFEDLDSTGLKNLGIVYFIYMLRNSETKLHYIGKAKGQLFRTRIRNHLVKKHKKTGAKLKLVLAEREKGNDIKFKFIATEPESLRNMLEEDLINYFSPCWNNTKMSKG